MAPSGYTVWAGGDTVLGSSFLAVIASAAVCFVSSFVSEACHVSGISRFLFFFLRARSCRELPVYLGSTVALRKLRLERERER